MENVSLKLKEDMAAEIEKLSKVFHYGTKTEFIREAIRDKIKELEVELFAMKIKKFQGIAKTHTSDEQLRKIKEKALNEFLKERGRSK